MIHESVFENTTARERDLVTNNSLNDFLRQVEQRAFITARLATQDEQDALDIVQDAMFKLAQNYGKHASTEWGALFHTILHSRINDWHRRRQVRNRWRVFFHRQDDDDDTPEPEESVAQTQFIEPEQAVLQTELNGVLQAAIGQLPLRQQQAVILRLWEGYDISSTAHIMKCSEGSVKTHYARALQRLRLTLGEFL